MGYTVLYVHIFLHMVLNIIIIIIIITIIIRPCFLSGVPLGLEVQEALKWRVTIFNKHAQYIQHRFQKHVKDTPSMQLISAQKILST